MNEVRATLRWRAGPFNCGLAILKFSDWPLETVIYQTVDEQPFRLHRSGGGPVSRHTPSPPRRRDLKQGL
jgi:hypothetical protein